MGDYSYGDEIWCCMAFCAQVEGIGVGGGCDCISVRKITVRQPDHSGQPQWEVSRCYSSLLSELAGGSLPDDSCPHSAHHQQSRDEGRDVAVAASSIT